MSSKNSLGKMKHGGVGKKYAPPYMDAARLRFAPSSVKNPALPFFTKNRRAGGR